jgi:hypothetical protein
MNPFSVSLRFDCATSAEALEVRSRCVNVLQAAGARGVCASGNRVVFGPSILAFPPAPSLPAADWRGRDDHRAIVGSGVVEVIDGRPIEVRARFSVAPIVWSIVVGFGLLLGLYAAIEALWPLLIGFTASAGVLAIFVSRTAASDAALYFGHAMGRPMEPRASREFWVLLAVVLAVGVGGLLIAAGPGVFKQILAYWLHQPPRWTW